MIEHKVGDVVEDNGVKYRAVKGLSCKYCPFFRRCRSNFYINKLGYCAASERKDGQNIGWEIVK